MQYLVGNPLFAIEMTQHAIGITRGVSWITRGVGLPAVSVHHSYPKR